MKHARTWVMVWGETAPAFSVASDKPLSRADSGFTVLFDDAPDPEEVEGPEHPGVSVCCLGCLLDDHPELGRALDIARQHGVADLDENDEWVVGDLSRLE